MRFRDIGRQHPTPDNMYAIAENLYWAYKQRNRKTAIVDWKYCRHHAADITDYSECMGNLGCVYSFAKKFRQFKPINFKLLDVDEKMYGHHGFELLVHDAGFINLNEMRFWADEYHEIWGNKHGGNFHTNARAYGSRSKKKVPLLQVCRHFTDIGLRLATMRPGEYEKEPNYPREREFDHMFDENLDTSLEGQQ